jgi:cellulose synthase/poly-beta-1,6-N-acetylglucosamine synthase-like glycosyltransferase
MKADGPVNNPATKTHSDASGSPKPPPGISPDSEICVITPYYKESIDVLKRCHESVVKQDVEAKVTHIMIADGFPLKEIDAWPVSHVVLPKGNGNNGNTPRGIGAVLAEQMGATFIGYLDADNWYHPGHLQSLLDLHKQTGADVLCSSRTYHDTQGNDLGATEEVEDNLAHVDTSAFLVHRNAFESNYLWLQMPNKLSPMCDRVFLYALKHKKYSIAHSKIRSLAFTTTYSCHYLDTGRQPPPDAKYDALGGAINFLYTPEGIKATSSALGIRPLTNFVRSIMLSIFPKKDSVSPPVT